MSPPSRRPDIEFDPEVPPVWTLENVSKYNNFYVYNRFLRNHYHNPQKTDMKRTALEIEDENGLMDIMCDCTAQIRDSPCNRLFYGTVACHNRAITTAKLKNLRPVTEVCDSYFFQLHRCMLKNNVPIKNPNPKK